MLFDKGLSAAGRAKRERRVGGGGGRGEVVSLARLEQNISLSYLLQYIYYAVKYVVWHS